MYKIPVYYRLIFLFVCHLSLLHVSAQSYLPIDDSTKKIVFEEIVKIDSTPCLTLQTNAESWMDKNFKSPNAVIRFDGGEGFIQSEGSFLVYTKGMVSKEIHGAIRFKVTIHTKPNKYRYVFSDFIFEYYKQNRQYQYVPTGKVKPLEDKKFPGWEKPWLKYKRETLQKVNAYIASLKVAMVYKKDTAEKKPVVKKEQW
jgi:hypothetical protein